MNVYKLANATQSRIRHSDWQYLVPIAAGIVFRISQYLANRSLWLDEVYLADNVLHRSYLELLQPLDDNQGAPILFLFLERLVVELVGTSEYAFRLVPLISGIISMFLFFAVARAFLKGGTLMFALVLFAVSDPLIYYASEVKQYSTDVTVALAIYAIAIRVRDKGLSTSNLLTLAAVGVGAVWLSDPALFVLAAVGMSLVVGAQRRQSDREVLLLGAVWTVWVVSFGVNYFVRLSNLGSNPVLQNYWQDYFAPVLLISPTDLRWYSASFTNLIRFLFQDISSLLAGLMLTLGLMSAGLKKSLWLLLAPLLFALMASSLHYYPFYQRFLLFTLPALIVLMALGIEFLWQALSSQTARIVGVLLIGLVVLPPTWSALVALTKPRAHEDIRPVIEYVLKHRAADDGLYVYYSAQRPLEYYLRQLGVNLRYVTGISSRDDWINYLRDLDQLRGKRRVWVLFSHVVKSEGVDEEKLFVQYLNHIGRRLDSFHREGASVYLYDFE